MTLKSSDSQTDSDLDSIRNSCDVFINSSWDLFSLSTDFFFKGSEKYIAANCSKRRTKMQNKCVLNQNSGIGCY